MSKWPIWFLMLLTMGSAAPAWGKDFKFAEPGYEFHFPSDHGSHEDYQIEWWYFTGHLTDKRGNHYGFELTFFRTGVRNESVRQIPSKWAVKNIYSAHFAISNETTKEFWFNEVMSREGLGKAGAMPGHFQVWIDQWMGRENNGTIFLTASDGTNRNRKGIEIQMNPEKPIVIHGESGTSPKDKESKNRSHYYSLTRLKTTGKLIWNGEMSEVKGLSWMDHEFGSNPLLPSQVGWDWFSIQLDNGTDIMLYQIRNRDGSLPFSFGTLIDEKGLVETLRQKDINLTPLKIWKTPEGWNYPTGWKVNIPERNISLTVTPSFQNQELTVFGGNMRYWEGSVLITGASSSGVGYLELTGYDTDLPSLFSQKGQ